MRPCIPAPLGRVKAVMVGSLHAYTVRDGKDGQKGFWTRISSFFAHGDGEGGTLLLDALPLDGRIVVRAPSKQRVSGVRNSRKDIPHRHSTPKARD